MRVDAHHHLWDLKAVRYPWIEAGGRRFFGDIAPIRRDYLVDEFRTEASARGFAASVHVQVGAADALAEARWVDAVAGANPGWPAAQVAFCDLTAPGRDAALAALAALPSLRGIRQIVGRAPAEDRATGAPDLLGDPRFAEGLAALAARGLSFDLQLVPAQMAAAARLVARLPGLRVALCHAGSPHDRSPEGLGAWAAGLRALAALPNVACKLSGLGMFEPRWTADSVRPIVAEVLEAFGPERVMFGSNFPVDSLTSTYAELVDRIESLVPPPDRPAVFGETARRFYRLGTAVGAA